MLPIMKQDDIYDLLLDILNEDEDSRKILKLKSVLKENPRLAEESEEFAVLWSKIKYTKAWDKIQSDPAWEKIVKRKKSPTSKRILPFCRIAGVILLCFLGYLLYTYKEDNRNLLKIREQKSLAGGKVFLTASDSTVIELGNSNMQIISRNGNLIESNTTGIVYVKTDKPDSQSVNYKKNKLTVKRGAEYKLILSDGTEIIIGPDSEIVYPEIFDSDKREVFLSGDAYFNVAKDSLHPFIVSGSNFSVNVLGTKFFISDHYDDSFKQISLIQGKVSVSKGRNRYILSPNQVLCMDRGENIKIKDFGGENLEKRIVFMFCFSDATLEEIMKKISRWNDVEIVYRDSSLMNYNFTGYIPKSPDIEKIINILRLASGIEFSHKEGIVFIGSKGK